MMKRWIVSYRLDGSGVEQVARSGRADVEEVEAFRHQQFPPLILGSFLAAEEDEHVKIKKLAEVWLRSGGDDAVQD